MTSSIEDQNLRRAVEEELEHEPGVDAASIGVAAHSGVVTLTGHVPSLNHKRLAEARTQRIRGVRAVVLELDVRVPEAETQSDEAIAERASETLAWHASPRLRNVKVTVSEGTIILRGQVDWQYERQAAEKLVAQLAGVKGVRNELRLDPKLAAEDVGKVIARALHRNAEVERSRIHIAVEGSKVILSGAAHTWHEQHMAEQAAWSTTGVTEVENNIEIGA